MYLPAAVQCWKCWKEKPYPESPLFQNKLNPRTMKKLSLAFVVSFFSLAMFAQQQSPEQYLDSIKGTFDKYTAAQRVKKQWRTELLNSERFAEMEIDVERISNQDKVDFTFRKILWSKDSTSLTLNLPFR